MRQHSTTARVVALPQLLSQIATLCVEPDDPCPANDPGAPTAAGGSALIGPTPAPGQAALMALVRLLGREAAREFFLAPANDDVAA